MLEKRTHNLTRGMTKVLYRTLSRAAFRLWRKSPTLSPSLKRPIWFHASSVGELESLWNLILACAHAKKSVVVTIFSPSAEGSLQKLRFELEKMNASFDCGYSPNEGSWEKALKKVSPLYFITSKYEAWPDLWVALTELNIPLVIVSARVRASLKIASRLCLYWAGKLPEMTLLAHLEKDVTELRLQFPKSKIDLVSDPRWERVSARIKKGSTRVQTLRDQFGHLKRPWGILGSVWIEDLVFLKPELASMLSQSTLWVVPHLLSENNLKRIENFWKRRKISSVRTSQVFGRVESVDVVIVDEMGFLAELYGEADWAYVGGGFGEGIHSTLEPALHGIPISGGPKRSTKFPEIDLLKTQKQLRILKRRRDLISWLQGLEESVLKKDYWREQNQTHLGATEQVMKGLFTR